MLQGKSSVYSYKLSGKATNYLIINLVIDVGVWNLTSQEKIQRSSKSMKDALM